MAYGYLAGGVKSLTLVGMQERKWQVADTLDYALLKENARANRNSPTEAEAVFWSTVRQNGLGQKCRRQYIIGQYIVDFFFRKSLLIVEIDGKYHSAEGQREKDAERQHCLESRGYRLLRFTNEEVLCNTAQVMDKIKNNL